MPVARLVRTNSRCHAVQENTQFARFQIGHIALQPGIGVLPRKTWSARVTTPMIAVAAPSTRSTAHETDASMIVRGHIGLAAGSDRERIRPACRGDVADLKQQKAAVGAGNIRTPFQVALAARSQVQAVEVDRHNRCVRQPLLTRSCRPEAARPKIRQSVQQDHRASPRRRTANSVSTSFAARYPRPT